MILKMTKKAEEEERQRQRAEQAKREAEAKDPVDDLLTSFRQADRQQHGGRTAESLRENDLRSKDADAAMVFRHLRESNHVPHPANLDANIYSLAKNWNVSTQSAKLAMDSWMRELGGVAAEKGEPPPPHVNRWW
jgi:hypothetical protein